MIDMWAGPGGDSWFAVAYHGKTLVATAIGSSYERAVTAIAKCIPPETPRRMTTEASPFAVDTVRMLAELESGDESNKRFALSEEYVAEWLRLVLTTAAAVPLGYVSTYGKIASIAGVDARTVGRTMATNPLYPIVPCHRVVGADMALVGYGGRQDDGALRAKLDRLRAETRGCVEREIPVAGYTLPLYPVEWVIRKASSHLSIPDRQLSLFD